MKPDKYIVKNEAKWNKLHKMHRVTVENFQGAIIGYIKNDNSVMGCFGPMWTQSACDNIVWLVKNDEIEIYSIDGVASE